MTRHGHDGHRPFRVHSAAHGYAPAEYGQPAPPGVFGQPTAYPPPVPAPRGPVVFTPSPPGRAAPHRSRASQDEADQGSLYSVDGYSAHFRGGTEPQAWSTDWGPQDDHGHNPVAVSARNGALARMVRFNHAHTTVAWDARKAQRVCPHALAFLYADPNPAPDNPTPSVPVEPGRLARPFLEETDRQRRLRSLRFYTILAATRLFHDTKEERDLADLMSGMKDVAIRYRHSGGVDPARQMTLFQDDTAGGAHFVGIGISTLDTPGQRWEQTVSQAEDASDLGGRCYVLLFDDTHMLIDRGPLRQVRDELGVHCTTDLNYQGGLAPRIWTHHPDTSTMTAPLEVWEQMNTIHQLVDMQRPRPTLEPPSS